jgi:hypothetical protein
MEPYGFIAGASGYEPETTSKYLDGIEVNVQILVQREMIRSRNRRSTLAFSILPTGSMNGPRNAFL